MKNKRAIEILVDNLEEIQNCYDDDGGLGSWINNARKIASKLEIKEAGKIINILDTIQRNISTVELLKGELENILSDNL